MPAIPPGFRGPGTRLQRSDIETAAGFIDVDVPALLAVIEVECRGKGVLDDGRPVILFEAHIFDDRTDGRFRAEHPNISSATWNRTLYGPSGGHQYERLAEALALDRDAALQSASWGLGQVMGFNFAAAGAATVEDFVGFACQGEPAQLHQFLSFLKSSGIDADLRHHRWADFARRYNGPAFAKNQYDTKLAAAFSRHLAGGLAQGSRGPEVRELQRALAAAGFDPRGFDGIYGKDTGKAVAGYQKSIGLPETGTADQKTLDRLLEILRQHDLDSGG